MFEVAGAVIGPLIATFLAGFGVWLKEWRGHRDDESRRQQALRRATEEVAFIDSWIHAFGQVSEPSASEMVRARAREDLERAYAVLSASRLPHVEGRDPAVVAERVREPVTIRRVLGILLMFPLRSWVARGLSIVYYISLLWALIWAGAGSSITFEEGAGPSDVVIGLIMIVVFGVAPACGLGALVWAIEHRAARRRQPSEALGFGPPPQSIQPPAMGPMPMGPNTSPP